MHAPSITPPLSRRHFGLLAPTLLLLIRGAIAAPAPAQTPLGATLVSGGVQFALYSQNASRVELWTFASPTASTLAGASRDAYAKAAGSIRSEYERKRAEEALQAGR